MEKTSYTILNDMRQAVASLREQLESLEAQMASLELSVKAEIAEAEAVAAEKAAEEAAAAAEKAAEEAAVAASVAAEVQPAPVAALETEAAPMETAEAPVETVEATVAEAAVAADDMPFYDDGDLPEPIDLGISDFNIGDIDIPAANINDAEAVNVKPAVMDVMAEKCAWKTDMPGTPVKNVLSAISLNDRILFVKTLFGEDAALFQQTIQIFNTYTTLDEAEAYVRTNFKNWDMNSDIVYRFMMAARRKLK